MSRGSLLPPWPGSCHIGSWPFPQPNPESGWHMGITPLHMCWSAAVSACDTVAGLLTFSRTELIRLSWSTRTRGVVSHAEFLCAPLATMQGASLLRIPRLVCNFVLAGHPACVNLRAAPASTPHALPWNYSDHRQGQLFIGIALRGRGPYCLPLYGCYASLCHAEGCVAT